MIILFNLFFKKIRCIHDHLTIFSYIVDEMGDEMVSCEMVDEMVDEIKN